MKISDALKNVPGEDDDSVETIMQVLRVKRFSADDPADGAFCELSESKLERWGLDDRQVCVILAAQKVAKRGRSAHEGPPGPHDVTQPFLQAIDLPMVPLTFKELLDFVERPLRNKDGSLVRLPVLDHLYEDMVRKFPGLANCVQRFSTCQASSLAAQVSAALNKHYVDPEDELVVAGYVDAVLWETMDLMSRMLSAPSLKRKRNCTEETLTSGSKRPDFILLLLNSLLFKGEDKTKQSDLGEAVDELQTKLSDWSVAYHNKVEYLLCYAAAGLTLRFCVLKRGASAGKTLTYLTDELQLNRWDHLLTAIFTSIKLFGVIVQQAKQLPAGRTRLGDADTRDNGTTITYFVRHVEKAVDVRVQKWLAYKATSQRLEKVYADVKGCPQLIQLKGDRIDLAHDTYRVLLEPLGTKLDGPPTGPTLRVAIKCVLQALKWLHTKGWGHGDVRWHNVIHLTDLLYVLIDLETVLPLNKAPPASHPKIHAWGSAQEALVDGKLTALSDLYMVGAMLQRAADLEAEGRRLAIALCNKQLPTAAAALEHAWLSEEQ